MVIVKLKGGLGNQLFQYALARKLSLERNVELKLDLSFFDIEATNHTKRDFELQKLNINAKIASKTEINALRKQRWKNFFAPIWMKEKGFTDFSKKIKRYKRDIYLDGFFQSEKFFKSAAETIKKDFTFKEPLNASYFVNLEQQIINSDSISIHFRRGDYVNDPKTLKHHGVCSMSYYQEAVNLIESKLNNPVFFVFSDDIEWVKLNFKCNFSIIYVEQSDEKLHSDFRLMSLCKNNIIANSTYSWWAAWLNPNEEKIVVAPKKWFNDQRAANSSSDLIPSEWITL